MGRSRVLPGFCLAQKKHSSSYTISFAANIFLFATNRCGQIIVEEKLYIVIIMLHREGDGVAG